MYVQDKFEIQRRFTATTRPQDPAARRNTLHFRRRLSPGLPRHNFSRDDPLFFSAAMLIVRLRDHVLQQQRLLSEFVAQPNDLKRRYLFFVLRQRRGTDREGSEKLPRFGI
jgi:hypothetical protein